MGGGNHVSPAPLQRLQQKGAAAFPGLGLHPPAVPGRQRGHGGIAQGEAHAQFPAQILHKGLIPVRLGAPNAVVEVGGLQGNEPVVPQGAQQAQQAHRIGAPRHRGQHPFPFPQHRKQPHNILHFARFYYLTLKFA